MVSNHRATHRCNGLQPSQHQLTGMQHSELLRRNACTTVFINMPDVARNNCAKHGCACAPTRDGCLGNLHTYAPAQQPHGMHASGNTVTTREGETLSHAHSTNLAVVIKRISHGPTNTSHAHHSEVMAHLVLICVWCQPCPATLGCKLLARLHDTPHTMFHAM